MMGGWWVWTYTVLMRRFQMQPSKGTLGRCTPVSMSVGMPPMKSRWMLRGWSLGNGCWKGGSSSTCTVKDLHTHAPLVSKRPAWETWWERQREREGGLTLPGVSGCAVSALSHHAVFPYPLFWKLCVDSCCLWTPAPPEPLVSVAQTGRAADTQTDVMRLRLLLITFVASHYCTQC